MSRLVLIHWNAAESAGRAEWLRAAGHQVSCVAPRNIGEVRAAAAGAPDAILIDLTRQPSQGQAIAIALRQYKPSRALPLVFLEGDAEKVSRTRALLPDALFTGWDRAAEELINLPRPVAPVVPGTMAGYSGTPLPKKLGIKPGSLVALLGAPQGFEAKLEPLPEGARVRRHPRGASSLILLFASSRKELERRFAPAVAAMAEGGGLWIVWPKKASGVVSDIGETEIRKHGLDAGLVDYKICAVDQTWSGLLFARRRR